MCVYVFMWVHILVYAYTYEKQRLMLGVLIVPNPRVWKTASHWHSLVSQSVPGILPSFLPSQNWVYRCSPYRDFHRRPGQANLSSQACTSSFLSTKSLSKPHNSLRSWCMDREVRRARKAQTADEVVGGVWAGKPWANREKNSRWRTWFGKLLE